MTTEQIARLETPFQERWWGSDHIVKPVVITEPMGDGRKFFAIQPLDTRPQYYIVRLDSGVNIPDDIDAILDHIEAQVGDSRYDGQDYGDSPWPELHADSGVSWWRIFRCPRIFRNRRKGAASG